MSGIFFFFGFSVTLFFFVSELSICELIFGCLLTPIESNWVFQDSVVVLNLREAILVSSW